MNAEDYEDYDEYDSDVYEDFGEGFEDDFDAVSEKVYERAFDKIQTEESDEEYEFDEVVGGRDKKPIMSILNKGKLSKYEMDDLLNQL